MAYSETIKLVKGDTLPELTITLKELIIDPPHRLINYGGARLINSEGSAY